MREIKKILQYPAWSTHGFADESPQNIGAKGRAIPTSPSGIADHVSRINPRRSERLVRNHENEPEQDRPESARLHLKLFLTGEEDQPVSLTLHDSNKRIDHHRNESYFKIVLKHAMAVKRLDLLAQSMQNQAVADAPHEHGDSKPIAIHTKGSASTEEKPQRVAPSDIPTSPSLSHRAPTPIAARQARRSKITAPTTAVVLLAIGSAATASAVALALLDTEKSVRAAAASRRSRAIQLQLLSTINHRGFGDGYNNKGLLTAE